MNKIKLSLGMLLLGTAFLVGNFVACGGKTSPATGAGGTGGGGTGGGGAVDSGMSATMTDGACVAGAYPHGGVCVCQDGTPTVCGNACVDVMVDNNNCGSCGTACGATATCVAGHCGPAATTLVPAITGCMALTLAAGGGSVYYADEGHNSISKIPSAGGAATVVSSTEMAPTWLTLSGTTLFWYNKTNKTIRMSAAGAAPANVYVSADPKGVTGFGFSADGATVYFSEGTNINSIPAAGGVAPTIVGMEQHGGLPGAIAVSGTTLAYPTNLNSDVDVIKVVAGTPALCGMEDPADSNKLIQVNCTRIARSQGEIFLNSIFAIGGKAYWIDGSNIKSESLTPAADATFDSISMTSASAITAAAATATTIYVAEDGFIDKTPLVKDSVLIQIARGQKAPTSIAVDGTKVYWATSDCTIGSTAQ
jgi:hypothetical protein